MAEYRVIRSDDVADYVVEAEDADAALQIGYDMAVLHSPLSSIEVEVELIEPQIAEDHSDEPEQQPLELDTAELTQEQRDGYEATLKIAAKALPILEKIEAGASRASNAKSIRLKAKECWKLMSWIVTLQQIGDVQSQQLEAAKAVIGSQAEALREYEEKTGRKLWVPGPV